MTTLEADIRTRTLADATITGLIGTRMTVVPAPEQTAMPMITYQLIAAPHGYAHDGDLRVVPYRYQFTCHATTYASAIAVASALVARWTGFKGTQGSTTFGATFIRDVLDDYQPDQKRYWRVVDIEFMVEG